MRRLLILFLSIPVFATILRTQNLSGRITDQKNLPLSDVYVYQKSGSSNSLSNERGMYHLAGIQKGDTLIFSSLGFRKVQLVLSTENISEGLDITMEEEVFELDQVNIIHAYKGINVISAIDLQLHPVQSSQEILRKIPGLFIGQHAGGGKAEQIFLRGFDIDHGTDIAITVDGLPVNMVSHAHGQGYADLHFLVPEVIESIDFGKGPYYTDHGNLNTAGYVDFRTKDRIETSRIGLEIGKYNTNRINALVSLKNEETKSFWLAGEYLQTDGPFESPQDFSRLNLMGKYLVEAGTKDRISLLISHFDSKWNASGQIPQRLVDKGEITRFGSVDDTEGGNTSRQNLNFEYTRELNSQNFIKTQLYYSRYEFNLYSNFSFFLNDPLNGDQIRQKENRAISGIHSRLYRTDEIGSLDVQYKLGAGLRYDNINGIELSHSRNRIITPESIQYGNIDETNFFAYAQMEINSGSWLFSGGLRFENLHFNYTDLKNPQAVLPSSGKILVLPKINILYTPAEQFQLYLKSGIGFHSNDTRVSIASGRDQLPRAMGIDLGAVWKPLTRIWLNAAMWFLQMEQEFVYVGDEGIVEPNGKSRRLGMDLSARIQWTDKLFFDGDLSLSHPRFLEVPDESRHIPLAPLSSATSSLSYKTRKGWSASLRFRYLSSRPATEDNILRTRPYFVSDFNFLKEIGKLRLGIRIENLFNTQWDEAQFATLSRLRTEIEAVEEIHFTPGTPFFIRLSADYSF